MGTDAGAAGAWGILLSRELQPDGAALLDALMFFMRCFDKHEDIREAAENGAPFEPGVGDLILRGVQGGVLNEDDLLNQFRADVAEAIGCPVPDEACLLYTDEDREHRSETPEDSLVLGVGLMRDPTKAFECSPEFAAKAQWWTWAWVG